MAKVARKRQSGGASLKLAALKTEKQIPSGSPDWARVTEWQRRGLVALRWDEGAAYAWVHLTEKGEAYLAANPGA